MVASEIEPFRIIFIGTSHPAGPILHILRKKFAKLFDLMLLISSMTSPVSSPPSAAGPLLYKLIQQWSRSTRWTRDG